MSEHSWTIRSYKEGDETGYVTLMNNVFSRYKCDLKRWRWEFMDNPFGSIQIFSDFRGNIVGYMGLICVPIKIENRVIRCSQAVDLAVHPNFRRKGMFLEIGKKLMQEAANEGIAISYGVPNEPAYRGHLKYGWFYVSEIPILIKIMSKKGFIIFVLAKFLGLVRRPHFRLMSRFMALIKNLIKVRDIGYCKNVLFSNDFRKHIVSSCNEQFDKLWKKVSKQFLLIVVRNAEYLNWRYVRKPHSKYTILTVKKNRRIEGFVVLSTEIHGSLKLKKGFIVDVFAKSEKAIHSLLQLALSYFVKENVDLATCWMMKNHVPYNCLLERGFINDSLSSQKLICRINTDDNEFKKLYHRVEKEWFFTMGDSDIV